METNPKKSQKSRIWEILMIVLVNLAILLVLIYGFEFYLTLTDPKLKLPEKPIEERNRYGFREREFAVPKPPDVCRIMALGDSFTWGKEVWAEERYTNILEIYLKQAYPDKKFEVINFGHTGSDTGGERDTLRQYKDLVQPDLIVLGFVINDTQPESQNYSVEREWWEENYYNSIDDFLEKVEDVKLERTADLIRKALDNFVVKIGLVPTWQAALQRTYEKESAQWIGFEQALRDIKSMSDEMNLPQPIFAVLNQGLYTDRPTDYRQPDEELQTFLEWYWQAEETAARLGYDPINYQEEFAEQLNGEIMAAHILDLHPSPAMHRIYAQKLFTEIATYVENGQLCPQDLQQ